jgi:uncharacterized protein YkwD
MKKLITILLVIGSISASFGQTAEEIEMVCLINKVRSNPESFIPAVEAYIASAKKLKALGVKTTNKTTNKSVDIVAEGEALITFLKSAKPVKTLSLSTMLYTNTKSHAQYLDSTKQLSHTGPNGQTLADRTKNVTKTAGENCGTGKTATDVMVQLLIDLSSPNKGHRNNIFNSEYTQVSVAKSGNTWVQDFIVTK